MAFVIEKIPEGLKEKLTYVVKPHLSSEWAVDRDNDAFVVITNKHGGPYEGTPETDHFILNWNNDLIEFAVDLLENSYIKEGAVANLRITSLKIPKKLENRYSEILNLIHNSLTAIGDCFNGKDFVAVNIAYDMVNREINNNNNR